MDHVSHCSSFDLFGRWRVHVCVCVCVHVRARVRVCVYFSLTPLSWLKDTLASY